MSKGLKRRTEKPKISEEKIKRDTHKCGTPKSAVFFGFEYMTSDSKYNFGHFKDWPKRNEALKEWSDFLVRLSRFSWTELQRQRKDQFGFETLEKAQFKNSLFNTLRMKKDLADDTKMLVFRFGGQKYRMVGMKSNSCPAAIHVIGFDWDHSLYDHG